MTSPETLAGNTTAILQRIGWYRALAARRANPDQAEHIPGIDAEIAMLDAYVTDEGWDPAALKAQAALPEPDMPTIEAMVLAHAAANEPDPEAP